MIVQCINCFTAHSEAVVQSPDEYLCEACTCEDCGELLTGAERYTCEKCDEKYEAGETHHEM